MVRRRITLALLLYVTLDFANPLMPGAVNFDPDTSVEGITAHHQVARSPFINVTASAPVSTELRATPRVRAPRRTRPVSGQWLTDVRRAHAGPSEPPPPTDDH